MSQAENMTKENQLGESQSDHNNTFDKAMQREIPRRAFIRGAIGLGAAALFGRSLLKSEKIYAQDPTEVSEVEGPEGTPPTEDEIKAVVDDFTPEFIRNAEGVEFDVDRRAYKRFNPDLGEAGEWAYWRPHNALDQENDFDSGWVTVQAEFTNPETGHRLIIEMNEDKMANRDGHPVTLVAPVEDSLDKFMAWDREHGTPLPQGTTVAIQLVAEDPEYANPDVGIPFYAGSAQGADKVDALFYIGRFYESFSEDKRADQINLGAGIARILRIITEEVYNQPENRVTHALLEGNQVHPVVLSATRLLLGEDLVFLEIDAN